MKKFTLLACLAAAATVSSVFASWQFSGGALPEDKHGGQNVNYETVVEYVGYNGTATLTCNGDGDVTMVQAAKDAFAYKFVDGDTFTVEYTPGVYEEHHSTFKANYTWTFSRQNVALQVATGTVDLVYNSNGHYEAVIPFALSETYSINSANAPRAAAPDPADENDGYVDTIRELLTWLDSGSANPFGMSLKVEFAE